MYKNLNVAALGVAGRQSECIELALNFGFSGLELDAAEMIRRARQHGVQEVACFVQSAKLNVNGFQLPCDLTTDDASFQSQLAELPKIAETAKEIGFQICEVQVLPASDDVPYHANFERHRQRLGQAADLLIPYGIRLGVGLLAAPKYRKNRAFQFIYQSEELLTLLRTVGSSSIGLALDTWNWKLAGGSDDQLAELRGDQIVSVRIAEVPLDADWSIIDENQRMLPGEESMPRIVALLQLLASKGYTGPVTLQPHSSQVVGKNREAKVELCAELLKQAFAEAGIKS
jgi:sugar phosphate isomerase/epimerase